MIVLCVLFDDFAKTPQNSKSQIIIYNMISAQISEHLAWSQASASTFNTYVIDLIDAIFYISEFVPTALSCGST